MFGIAKSISGHCRVGLPEGGGERGRGKGGGGEEGETSFSIIGEGGGV